MKQYGFVTYKGKTYKTVVIGTQTWMAENLNYKVIGEIHVDGSTVDGSICNNNSENNCTKYGSLYSWTTAMGIDAKYNKKDWGGSDVKHQGICPSGWHIPSNADWNVLMKFVNPSCSDNDNTFCGAGTKLKAQSGWIKNGNGTDDYGFSALPGGYGRADGRFVEDCSPGFSGYWWSASEHFGITAYIRAMYHYGEHQYDEDHKDFLFSVRCLQDD